MRSRWPPARRTSGAGWSSTSQRCSRRAAASSAPIDQARHGSPSGYGWITVVAPIVIAAPVYFAGDMTFGGLMMAVGAFNQVHASLRWFVDNIGGIADWRATLLRVAAFRSAMLKADELHDVEKRIAFAEAEAGHLTLRHIAGRFARTAAPSWPSACRRSSPASGSWSPATPARARRCSSGRSPGLWPWGSGRIGLPKGEAGHLHSAHALFPAGVAAGRCCAYPLGSRQISPRPSWPRR